MSDDGIDRIIFRTIDLQSSLVFGYNLKQRQLERQIDEERKLNEQFGVWRFEVEIMSGELGLSEETTDFGWYTVAEMEAMDTMENHVERIHNAVKNQSQAVFQ